MKQMKITIEMVEPKSPLEAMKEAKKPKSIKSLKDLRNLFDEEDEDLSYGERSFGATPEENDETEGRLEGDQKLTPDDKALSEDAETRVKKSKNPTIVGKKMK
jgi:hypothetical protein